MAIAEPSEGEPSAFKKFIRSIINPRFLRHHAGGIFGIVIAVIVIGLSVWGIYEEEVMIGLKRALLLFSGLILGIVFFSSDVSFGGAVWDLISKGSSTRSRQIVLILLTCSAIYAPFLAFNVAGVRLFPIGIGGAIGALIFGLGMGISRSSTSDLLMHIGSGMPNVTVSVICYLMGAVVGAWQVGPWEGLPYVEPIWLLEYGPVALCMHFTLLIGLYMLAAAVEVNFTRHAAELEYSLWPSAWPLVSRHHEIAFDALATVEMDDTAIGHRSKAYASRSAVVLVPIFTLLILVIVRVPWEIGNLFVQLPLRALCFFRVIPAEEVLKWPYFRQNEALSDYFMASAFVDPCLLIAMGFLVGVFAAANYSGHFAHRGFMLIFFCAENFASKAIGSFLMGFGGTIAHGGNIEVFSSVAAGSVDGWVRLSLGFFGAWFGVEIVKRVAGSIPRDDRLSPMPGHHHVDSATSAAYQPINPYHSSAPRVSHRHSTYSSLGETRVHSAIFLPQGHLPDLDSITVPKNASVPVIKTTTSVASAPENAPAPAVEKRHVSFPETAPAPSPLKEPASTPAPIVPVPAPRNSAVYAPSPDRVPARDSNPQESASLRNSMKLAELRAAMESVQMAPKETEAKPESPKHRPATLPPSSSKAVENLTPVQRPVTYDETEFNRRQEESAQTSKRIADLLAKAAKLDTDSKVL